METALTSDPDVHRGNADDTDYFAMLHRMNQSYLRLEDEPAFTTDADALWDAYLAAMPEDRRQHHTCHACRHFVERFGHLATITPEGRLESLIWHEEDASPLYVQAVETLARLVRRAKVTGVFLSGEKVWGQPETGPWRHLAIQRTKVFRHAILTPFQAMAEKHEDFLNVGRALREFPEHVVQQALGILRADALYRSEKVLGQAEFLADLHGKAPNLVWRAVATAPAGFCHPRASMIGTLLADLAQGGDFADVQARFARKMRPEIYQRPQAAPKAGAIAQAEKIVEQLAAAGAFERRFARLEDLQTIWTPRKAEPREAKGGVFGHLTPKGEAADLPLQAGSLTITFAKLRATVLPGAREIHVYVPHGRAGFGAFVTATNPEAPPILQWDREDRRNPVSGYVYVNGSPASQWALKAGTWEPLTAIALQPWMWWDGEYPHQGKGAMLAIAGARDVDNKSLALFPETLRSEFHGIRSVIEAHSRSRKLSGAEEASAAGLMISGQGAADIRLRVRGDLPLVVEYRVDRWD